MKLKVISVWILLQSWKYINLLSLCTHILLLKLQSFLEITEVSGHQSFLLTEPASKKLFFFLDILRI